MFKDIKDKILIKIFKVDVITLVGAIKWPFLQTFNSCYKALSFNLVLWFVFPLLTLLFLLTGF